MSVLDNILAVKRQEVDANKRLRPTADLRKQAGQTEPVRPFGDALRRGPGVSLIAEIKKASPSRGVIVEHFDPVRMAQEFERGGARALSVLTDEKFFQGDPAYVDMVKSATSLPVLRKDFIIDEYQVYESRALGADAILLIVKALDQAGLEQLHTLARSIGLEVLVEAHTEDEVMRANRLGASIIGINNRDLTTFDVSLDRSERLGLLIASGAVKVAESGMKTREDIERLSRAGFHAVLVGEGLAVGDDRARAARDLLGSA